MKDYYKILQLDKKASPEEIRKAYKKLALQWHPDRNKGNEKVAGEKFKEISEAYQVLSDPQKRQRYDNPGFEDFPGFSFRDPFNLFKMFQSKGFFDDDDFFKEDHFGDFGKGFGRNMPGFGDFGTFSQQSSSQGQGNNRGSFSTSKSVSKSTTIKNGKKVTVTTTKILNQDGTETVERVEEIDNGDGSLVVNTIKNGEQKTLTYKK